MSRIGKTGLIVLAIVGLLSFFSPFDNGQVLGAPPTHEPQPVTVTNTPLPVTVTNPVSSVSVTNTPLPVTAPEPTREVIWMRMSAPTQPNPAISAWAGVDLTRPATIESIFTSCIGTNNALYLTTSCPSPVTWSVTTLAGTVTPSSCAGFWIWLANNLVGQGDHFNVVNIPVGTYFRVQALNYSTPSVLSCDVSIVVRYAP